MCCTSSSNIWEVGLLGPWFRLALGLDIYVLLVWSAEEESFNIFGSSTYPFDCIPGDIGELGE